MRYFYHIPPGSDLASVRKAQSAGGMWVTGFSTPNYTLKGKERNPKNEKMRDLGEIEKKMQQSS